MEYEKIDFMINAEDGTVTINHHSFDTIMEYCIYEIISEDLESKGKDMDDLSDEEFDEIIKPFAKLGGRVSSMLFSPLEDLEENKLDKKMYS